MGCAVRLSVAPIEHRSRRAPTTIHHMADTHRRTWHRIEHDEPITRSEIRNLTILHNLLIDMNAATITARQDVGVGSMVRIGELVVAFYHDEDEDIWYVLR